jgi:hypothetical protein
VVKGGAQAYGSYSDIDALYQQQAVELDQTKRAAILEKIQQLELAPLQRQIVYPPLIVMSS